MLIAISTIFAFALLTAIASGLHGTDKAPKGIAVAYHAIGGFLLSPYSLIAVAVYWCFFRRSKQAIAELDYLGSKGSIDKVRDAYPPVIGVIMAKVMQWVQRNPWRKIADKRVDGTWQPSRLQQEFVGGAVLGAILYVPVAIFF
jgi:hypothetical protein